MGLLELFLPFNINLYAKKGFKINPLFFNMFKKIHPLWRKFSVAKTVTKKDAIIRRIYILFSSLYFFRQNEMLKMRGFQRTCFKYPRFP